MKVRWQVKGVQRYVKSWFRIDQVTPLFQHPIQGPGWRAQSALAVTRHCSGRSATKVAVGRGYACDFLLPDMFRSWNKGRSNASRSIRVVGRKPNALG